MKLKNELVVFQETTNKTTADEMPYIFVTEFNDTSVINFYKSFITLSANPKILTIPIVISSYGGQLHSLFAMLDIISHSDKPVATIGLGKAMSCGAVLLACGTKGYRYSAPNTDIMIHEVSNAEWGKNAEIQNGAKHTKKLNNDMLKILSKQSKDKTFSFFETKMMENGNVDWFLTSEEYKKLGLIDFVSVPKFIKN